MRSPTVGRWQQVVTNEDSFNSIAFAKCKCEAQSELTLIPAQQFEEQTSR